MPLIIPKPSASDGDFERAPAGNFAARCISIVDMGMQTSTYNGEDKTARKVRLAWELCGEYDGRGRIFVVSKRYTLSLHERAALRKDLESWRGRAFTEAELEAFDLAKLLGAPCMVNVVHVTSQAGKTYANVNAITSVPKGLKVPPCESDQIVFSLDDPHNLDQLPEWLIAKINFGSAKPAAKQPQPVAAGDDDLDDTIPF